jgi:hypothetical protein
METLPTLFYNPSANEWNTEPYMAKEYTTYTPDGYAATVVVIPMPGKPKKDGEETTAFVPMGVRIEHTRSRRKIGRFVLPGNTFFIKRTDKRVSMTNPFTFQTIGGELVLEKGRPKLNKPRKDADDYSRDLSDHPKAALLQTLQAAAMAKYDEYRAEKRAA